MTTNEQLTDILEIFNKINPSLKYSNTTEREAVLSMFMEASLGYEKTKKAAEYAVSIQGKQFAPTIIKPTQLYQKLPLLRTFYSKYTKPSIQTKLEHIKIKELTPQEVSNNRKALDKMRKKLQGTLAI